MYTIISGTNRIGSNTLKVAREYQRMMKEKGIDANLFSLEGLDLLNDKAKMLAIEKEIIMPSEKLLFIIPEYNGSYPGILKMFIDSYKPQDTWWHKKALLTGVSAGRAGNLRGMEHLSGVLNYLKVTVYPELLPISVIDTLMDANGTFIHAATITVVNRQLDGFIKMP